MSTSLRPPSLGPIVGHTTPTSARIWIRGAEFLESRSVGIAALFQKNRYVPKSARYFRLHREYDRTGITDFEGLMPDTSYQVKTASLMMDSSGVNASVTDEDVYKKLPNPEIWIDELKGLQSDESEANFCTFPNPPLPNSKGLRSKEQELRFIFGSCRYPGLLWKKSLSDRIFDAIYQRFKTSSTGSSSPRFVLMVGDQIYADKFNKNIPIGLADTEEEFRERYLTAFGSPNMRRLLRSVPQYMILDDHEIEDNWVQGRIKNRESRALFNIAISAYMSYQWIHSPRSYDKRLYYHFACAGYPFFVTDCRTQRIRDDEDTCIEDNHMLGNPAKESALGYEGQIDILCGWLQEQQKLVGNRPKFVVFGSVFVPNNVSSVVKKDAQGQPIKDHRWKDDAWAAFPKTRQQILKTIMDHGIQNVVFLSGDIHCSNVAEISFHHNKKGRLPIKAFAITSSAFYWPFPFADGDPLDYVHDSQLEGDGFAVDPEVTMHYKAMDFEQDDNFIEVSVGEKTLTAETFNKEGTSLRVSKLTLA